jgi:gamma-glutamylcyclotransferase (GGCT)/AIG2-like uncharacterized protein YtfP
MEYLFVYGTLLKHFDIEVLKPLKDKLQFVNEATLPGTLLDLGEYPAYLESTAGKVKGEVYSMGETQKVFKVLDEYEGDEYSRKQQWVRLNTEEKVRCWVYVYRLKPQPEHKIIMNGDYVAFIRNKG